jgi:site-specific recombinase XerD
MSEWPARYLRHLELECGYARNTLRCYGRILEDFVRFIGDRGPKLRRLSRDDLRRYVLELRDGRANCARSIRLKLQAIRSFLGYLDEQRAGPRSILFGKTDFRYKIEHREAESLSQPQLALLLDTVTAALHDVRGEVERAADTDKRKAKRLFGSERDLCLFTLLASTGLRISEALGIRLADIDAVDKSIRVTGKGNKIRKVFFDLQALEQTLSSYLTRRRSLPLPHDYVFVSTREYRPLQPRGVQKLLKAYLRKARLSTSTTPHTLRHSFATLAIERGANLKAVSQILGHANCSITVDLYTHLSAAHLREVMQLCSPLATTEIPIEERIRLRKQNLAYLGRTG